MTRIHVVQKVNQLLTSAISTGVSDIHFEPFEVVFRVRCRIDGVLKTVEYLPGTNKVNQVSYVYGSNRQSANQITTHSNYIYDDNGSVLSSAKLNKNLLMDYDIRSNLVSSIAVNNQYIIDYDYDASGERVYSGMGNSSKIYINSFTSNPLTIIDSNDNVTHYIYGPKGIVAKRNENLTYFMLKDHLGSTRVMMNENNQAISSYDYDAWGNPINSTVSEMSAYRYTGREYDDETGLHNFRARLYDSVLMRFYQVDPAEQFASPYVYCGNNPIGLVDPDGERVRFQGNDDDVQYTMSNLSLGDYQISMDNDGYLHVPNDIDRTQLTEQDNMIVDFILDTSGTTVLDFSSTGFTNGLLSIGHIQIKKPMKRSIGIRTTSSKWVSMRLNHYTMIIQVIFICLGSDSIVC